MDRGYVQVRSGSLVPSWTAFSVVRLLENSFGPYVNYEFTAQMEEDLDRIARGEESRVEWLGDFYLVAGCRRNAGSSRLWIIWVILMLAILTRSALLTALCCAWGKFGPLP